MHASSIKFCFSICMALILSKNILAQKNVNIDWSVVAELPSEIPGTKHLGLAGAFSGIINNTLILIGGANFPDKMPWDGGVKKYHNDVHLLDLLNNSPNPWNKIKIKFPENIAYGASLIYNHKLICIGGENENGLSDKIWEVSLNATKDNLIVKELCKLPIPLTNLSASRVRHILYIAGGESKSEVSNNLYSIDLNHRAQGIKCLSKIPVAISHSLLLPSTVNRGIDLYLIGGRKKNTNGISTLYSSVFKYSIKKDTWIAQAVLPYSLSALSGVSIASNQFVIIGGDRGDTFSKTENYLSAIQTEIDTHKKQEFINQKNRLQINHPGFSKDILHYDVKKNAWSILGELTYEAPVTTTALFWNKSIILPSGEIKAGVRTPKILMGKLKQK